MRASIFFNNWSFPTEETIRADFAEYKAKEYKKWKSRAKLIGAKFPMFINIEEFKNALRNAKVTNLEEIDHEIINRSHTTSIDALKSLVSSYAYPRDVERIVSGFKNNDPIPYPLVLKGSRGMWIMAGNTRLDAAGILGIPKKALVLDVSDS